MSRSSGIARAAVAVSIGALTLLGADRAIGWAHGPVVKPVNAMGLTSGISEAGTHLRPGFTGTYRSAEFAITVQVNSLGLRGPEVTPAEPAGGYRILAVGDSFTFGQGVEFEQAWPALLEQRIGAPAQVVNAGWSAGSPVGYERYLSSRGLDLQPDIVLMAIFVGNDVVEDMVERHAGPDPLDQLEYESRYVANLRMRVGPVGAVREFLDIAFPNIYELATLAIVKAQYFVGSHRSHFDYVLADTSDPELEAGWTDTLATLGRIDAAVRTRGARFGVIIIPFYDQVASTGYGPGFTKDRPQRRIASFCAERRIPCLDLLPALQRQGAPETLYYVKDGHWSPRGQEVAAAAIVAWVREQRLVPLP